MPDLFTHPRFALRDTDVIPWNPEVCAITKHIRAHLVARQLGTALENSDPRGETLLQKNDRQLRAMGLTERRRCRHLIHSNPFWQGLTCPECGKAV